MEFEAILADLKSRIESQGIPAIEENLEPYFMRLLDSFNLLLTHAKQSPSTELTDKLEQIDKIIGGL